MQVVQRVFAFLSGSCLEGVERTGFAGFGMLSCPLAGLALGLLLSLVNRLLEPHLHSEILATLLVSVLVVLTGGAYLRGTEATFDSPAHFSRGRISGLIAILLVVIFKIRSIEVTGEGRGLSLLLTPLLARWSLLLFLFGSMISDRDSSRETVVALSPWQLLAATVLIVSFGVGVAGRKMLWVALCLSIFALLARLYLYRREGSISYASCGAVIEISEAFGFTLYASL